jgi:hypothetical protein
MGSALFAQMSPRQSSGHPPETHAHGQEQESKDSAARLSAVCLHESQFPFPRADYCTSFSGCYHSWVVLLDQALLKAFCRCPSTAVLLQWSRAADTTCRAPELPAASSHVLVSVPPLLQKPSWRYGRKSITSVVVAEVSAQCNSGEKRRHLALLQSSETTYARRELHLFSEWSMYLYVSSIHISVAQAPPYIIRFHIYITNFLQFLIFTEFHLLVRQYLPII